MSRESREPDAGAREGEPPVRRAEPEPEGRELLALSLGDALFGLWTDEVLEIVRTPPISRLPLPHPEVPGVTSVRGEVVPVLDLGLRLLGSPAARPGRLVLVRHEPTDSVIGLLVDGVQTLLTVADNEIEDAPKAAEAALPPELVRGVVVRDEGVVTILHLGRATVPPETTDEKDEPT